MEGVIRSIEDDFMTDYEEIVRKIIELKNTTSCGIINPRNYYDNLRLDFELINPRYHMGHPTQIREAYKKLIAELLER
jgi:hypothetical protein